MYSFVSMHMLAFISAQLLDFIGTPLTGHFVFDSFTDVINDGLMVKRDDEKVVMDENFDYDPSRALDLVEMTTVELVGEGELPNDAYAGAPSKFSFWKAAGEGLFSVGWGQQA